jgi:hypothetical protein
MPKPSERKDTDTSNSHPREESYLLSKGHVDTPNIPYITCDATGVIYVCDSCLDSQALSGGGRKLHRSCKCPGIREQPSISNWTTTISSEKEVNHVSTSC